MSTKSIGFVGPKAVNVMSALVIASGLRLYAKTGIKPNRMYTPSNMLAAASRITGKKYKRGQYLVAADDVTEVAQAAKAQLTRTETDHSISFE